MDAPRAASPALQWSSCGAGRGKSSKSRPTALRCDDTSAPNSRATPGAGHRGGQTSDSDLGTWRLGRAGPTHRGQPRVLQRPDPRLTLESRPVNRDVSFQAPPPTVRRQEIVGLRTFRRGRRGAGRALARLTRHRVAERFEAPLGAPVQGGAAVECTAVGRDLSPDVVAAEVAQRTRVCRDGAAVVVGLRDGRRVL